MRFLQRILPDHDEVLKWVSIGITTVLAGIMMLICIYWFGDYGLALFFFIPFFIGAAPVILYGAKKPITKREAFQNGLVTMAIAIVGLLLFAIEGLICIIMSLPLIVFLMWLGSYIGYAIVSEQKNKGPVSLLLIILLIPITAFVEKDYHPPLTSVVTSIEIKASPETVWKNVIEFPQLDEPNELIFKAGIAYPINAKIEGKHVGAIRHCNFTTGSFVEPITVWNEPKLLKFSVIEQPAPMKELTFWDIDAPHLHDYFVSKEGQFKLKALPNGNTLLEGTTWYYHDIRPAAYWQLWSNYIIHRIHWRVLSHIKTNAENQS